MNPIKDSSLLGEVRGPISGLKGYSKPKFKLSKHSEWEQSFIRNAGAEDVAVHATALFHKLRDAFRYLRKDFSFSIEGSTGSMKSPDFDVNLALNQDPEDAERYILTTQVTSFRDGQILEDPRFIEVFSSYCDRIVIELTTPIDLAAKIDEVEQIDWLAEGLDYDPACTFFVLRLTRLDLEIRVTRSEVACRSVLKRDLKSLILHTIQAFSQLSGASVYLGISQ